VIGGKVDDDNVSLKSEALREFHEETGYTGQVTLIPSFVYRDGDFSYHNFIGIVPNEFQPQSNWETDKFEWITLDELLKIQPKHFGLKALLQHAMTQIKHYLD
jgi:8-oxo-dGTP pyrophosphatase MutT (NUDIX family)